MSIFGLKFLKPYLDVIEMKEDNIKTLIDELKLELPDNHILFNLKTELIAKKITNDDIVLQLENGNIAVVHLTWKTKKENIEYPITRFYHDKLDFWNREMKRDIIEFKEKMCL
ncbi:hypothetical protein SAMN04489761_0992 [Tenacibaculum sp. MAR_2009_124]|uniref:hypothetical protein n=1 Tax=Tenacibaculum sp. MAR_2009_124 TaxID=1250059 RepID=UPI000894F8AA|nr:hypothetical protein [Tenacibaculum sp. MAR_2009_124]SEB48623.1 hypothetical protein SAMN04489761_0992 [Tenacibaculum sp. MAR_2009_124]